MTIRFLGASIAAAALCAALVPVAAGARPFTQRDLATLRRLSDPAVSPDGRRVAFQLRETDWAANKGRQDIWLLDLGAKRARPVKLAADPQANETAPAFSPDGGTVYFLSNKSGHDEVWRVPAAGGAAVQVTTLGADVGGFLLSPAGDRLLVWADRPVGARSPAAAPDKPADAGAGQLYDRLFVRHWDSWADGNRSQLFTVPLKDGAVAGGWAPLVGALVGDTPSKPFGGREEIAWSPDGQTIYFALREAGRIEATSTNLDIFAVPADGSAAPVDLTAANKATDNLPAVSPDGRWLAWAAMARPGFEADRMVVQLRDLRTGTTRALTAAWDRSAGSIAWASDSRSLLVTAGEVQDEPLFRVDAASGQVTRLTGPGHVAAALPLPRGQALVALDSLTAPDDLWRVGKGSPLRLTAVNADKLAGVDMPQVSRFIFAGANGDVVHGIALKPPGLAAGAKAPIAYLIHGGPQGSFGDSWSYRWNPAVWADAGFGTVAVDFHGSTGYGQAFTDAISGDWGGKPLEDLKLGLAAATARYAWLDADNACAAGGSYGGYMINWIAGNWPDRFKCLINHDGVFDARGMAYSTEELWFDEWEHNGKTYYQAPEEYEKWNPANHVDRWQTPMLVVHGEKDFRIPVAQGLSTFTALQRRGIPSELLAFSDENHWVLKPRNSVQWYDTVLAWMKRWTAR